MIRNLPQAETSRAVKRTRELPSSSIVRGCLKVEVRRHWGTDLTNSVKLKSVLQLRRRHPARLASMHGLATHGLQSFTQPECVRVNTLRIAPIRPGYASLRRERCRRRVPALPRTVVERSDGLAGGGRCER
jgi:hypothetical protein